MELREAIIRLPGYLQSKGYQTYDSFVSDFFALYKKADIEIDTNTLEAIIRPILLKNSTDYKTFHDDFVFFLQNADCLIVSNEQAKQIKKEQEIRQELERAILNYDKSSKERRKKLSEYSPGEIYSEKEKEKIKNAIEKAGEEYKRILKSIPDGEELKDCFDKTHSEEINEEKAREVLKRVLFEALYYKNYEDIFKIVELQRQHLEKLKKHKKIFDPEEEARKAKEEEELRQKLQEELDKRAKNISDIIKVKPVLNHRENFMGKNSVYSEFSGELLNKRLGLLKKAEQKQIEEYIRENAKKFRTRLSNKIKTKHKKKPDIHETCKAACATNGIPMDLKFTKPKKQKSKLVMFLDISGSCCNASKLLLTFMHQMKSVFPDGCEIFVFVNSLYDVSSLFMESNSAEDFINKVFEVVPVKGVYSNYFMPLEAFYKEYFSKLTKDSIVIFMGDARNNKNETGEDYVKAIARKAKKAYWLNTEGKSCWNTYDSIINVYGQYMDDVREVLTTADVLNFLVGVR